MLKKIAIALAVVIAGILAFAATKPDTFRVERSAVMKASPDKVFAHFDDFHNWGAWSPWEKMDPGMKRTFSGAAKGKGAVYEWDGNDKVGAGRMEILESAGFEVYTKEAAGLLANVDALAGAPSGLPAAPLLVTAYSVVVLALFAYVLSVARRLGSVQRELERLEADLKRSGRT